MASYSPPFSPRPAGRFDELTGECEFYEPSYSPTSPSYTEYDRCLPASAPDGMRRRATLLAQWSSRLGCRIVATAHTDDEHTLVITDTPPKPRCNRCIYRPYCTGTKCKVRDLETDGEWRRVKGAWMTDFDAAGFMGAEPSGHRLEYDHSECAAEEPEGRDIVYMCNGCKCPLAVEEVAIPAASLHQAGINPGQPLEVGSRLLMRVKNTTRECECEGGCGAELLSQRHLVSLEPVDHPGYNVMAIDSKFLCPAYRAKKRKQELKVLDKHLATMSEMTERLRDDLHALPEDYEWKAMALGEQIAKLAAERRKRRRVQEESVA